MYTDFQLAAQKTIVEILHANLSRGGVTAEDNLTQLLLGFSEVGAEAVMCGIINVHDC